VSCLLRREYREKEEDGGGDPLNLKFLNSEDLKGLLPKTLEALFRSTLHRTFYSLSSLQASRFRAYFQSQPSPTLAPAGTLSFGFQPLDS